MAKNRVPRVEEVIKRELSQILLKDMQIPDLGFITITQVVVSADLQQAKVFVSVFEDKDVQENSLLTLNKHALGMQRLLRARLHMRYIPNLEFILDDSAAYSDYIARRLLEIKRQDEERKPRKK